MIRSIGLWKDDTNEDTKCATEDLLSSEADKRRRERVVIWMYSVM